MLYRVKQKHISRLTISNSSFVNVFEGSSSLISSSIFKGCVEREREWERAKNNLKKVLKYCKMINFFVVWEFRRTILSTRWIECRTVFVGADFFVYKAINSHRLYGNYSSNRQGCGDNIKKCKLLFSIICLLFWGFCFFCHYLGQIIKVV